MVVHLCCAPTDSWERTLQPVRGRTPLGERDHPISDSIPLARIESVLLSLIAAAPAADPRNPKAVPSLSGHG